MDSRALMKRFTDAKGNWQNWRSLYDEAYSYAIPERNPWPYNTTEGRKKNIQVYDITAVNSTRRLVSRLHSSLVPPGEQWFGLEVGDNTLNPDERKEANMFLQMFTDIIFQTLNDSNFDLVVNEMLQDLTIGTGAMMILESDNKKCPIQCKSVSIDIFYPEANAFDELETNWREFNNVPGQDIKRFWKRAELTQTMKDKMNRDPMAKFNFVEGVVYVPSEDHYRIVVMECGQNEYILDVISKSSPWVVARWSKSSNEVGGRGPVIDALPTIRSLNALTEEIMRNVALSTSPPWTAASDGVFNPYLFQIEPNKIIPISRQSMGEMPLKRLDVAGDVNMGNLEVNDLRSQIKDALFDNPVRPVASPEQTATEVMIRQQQFMEEIGPAFGRLTVELLPKIINRVVFILQKRGHLPPNLKIDNKSIMIRYKSPLVKSSQLAKVQNLQNYMSILQPIMGQEMAMASLNIELLPEWTSDKLNVDAQLVKNPTQILALIKQAMQSQQAPNPADGSPNQTQEIAQDANSDEQQ